MEQSVQYMEKPMELKFQPKFSDAHCHPDIFKDPGKVLAEARQSGVGTIIGAGGNTNSNNAIAEMCDANSIFGVIGIDPSSNCKEYSIKAIEEKIKANSKIIGIGEIGLDLVKSSIEENLQKSIFSSQLELAEKLGIPVVIHSRGAIERVAEILQEYKSVRAMFHFFEGDEDTAVSLASRGHIISFPPVKSAKRMRVAKALSAKHIAVETDSPVVGQSPSDVIRVFESISEAKGINVEELADTVIDNLRELFYI
jgi:TatD DNase family protein